MYCYKISAAEYYEHYIIFLFIYAKHEEQVGIIYDCKII